MIKLGDTVINQNHFPDNSLFLRVPWNSGDSNVITWYYENDAELFTIICLRKHYGRLPMVLNMPYCPHARMDRVKNYDEVFTLKYFCDVINSLNFTEVYIKDPHSNVCTALLNNVAVNNADASKAVSDIIRTYNDGYIGDNLVFFYPDDGAGKRYNGNYGCTKLPFTTGSKKRDWRTGNIEKLVINEPEVVNGKDVLIVDDICSRGGTFLYSAKALKEAGAKNIYLYITHCENTILEGEILTSGLIEKVFTTNSIFTKKHGKIVIIDI